MSNLILRFSLFSYDDSVDIYSVARLMPKDNIEQVYAKGDMHGKKLRNESSIDYLYSFREVNSVDDFCNEFVNEWTKFSICLKQFNLSSYILFEFDLESGGFPELVFPKAFTSFIAEHNIELQLFFYKDD